MVEEGAEVEAQVQIVLAKKEAVKEIETEVIVIMIVIVIKDIVYKAQVQGLALIGHLLNHLNHSLQVLAMETEYSRRYLHLLVMVVTVIGASLCNHLRCMDNQFLECLNCTSLSLLMG